MTDYEDPGVEYPKPEVESKKARRHFNIVERVHAIRTRLGDSHAVRDLRQRAQSTAQYVRNSYGRVQPTLVNYKANALRINAWRLRQIDRQRLMEDKTRRGMERYNRSLRREARDAARYARNVQRIMYSRDDMGISRADYDFHMVHKDAGFDLRRIDDDLASMNNPALDLDVLDAEINSCLEWELPGMP